MRAIITSLVATIVGGILIYHYTNVIGFRNPKIIFSNEAVSISGQEVAATVATISAENIGTKSAKDVEIIVYHEFDERITESQFSLDSGPVTPNSVIINDRVTQITLDEQRSADGLDAKLIFDGVASENIEVKIRANDITGQRKEEYEESKDTTEKIGIVVIIFCGLVLFSIVRQKRKIKKNLATLFDTCRM